MPASSHRQRRWAFAVKGEAWARKHHFDRVEPRKRKRRKHKAELDALVRALRKG